MGVFCAVIIAVTKYFSLMVFVVVVLCAMVLFLIKQYPVFLPCLQGQQDW
jgi:hypothetical protein